MKFVIAPDSYKGSLSAVQVCSVMAEAIRSELPDADVDAVPMADGGEGTVDTLVAACRGETIRAAATGPMGQPEATYYGILSGENSTGAAAGPVAILEAANVCGLTMVPPALRSPLHTTSRGLGELLRQALDRGIRRFAVGLGGSAVNDGGMGLLTALGARFTDADGAVLNGSGAELARVASADFGGLDRRLAQCELTVASDVRNPLCGPDGASHVYGPQKGATPEQAVMLDAAMRQYAARVEAALGRPLAGIPGAGAAGGLGFALLALGAELQPGAAFVADMTGLRARMREADFVLTGEGRSDEQTLFGKLPLRVAQWAEEAGKPAVLVSGSLGGGLDRLQEVFTACFSIVPGPADLDSCMQDAERNLRHCTRSVVRLLAAGVRSGQRIQGGTRI